VLCYTTDGSTPTEVSNLCSGGTTSTYSTPISVATTQTVKAIGTLATYTDSAVGSATYTISASCSTSGIIAKYDADSLSASPVTTNWPDTSGNGYSMVPHNSPTWASNVIGGHSAVTLNGTNQEFDCYATCDSGPGYPVGTNITVYVVTELGSSFSGIGTFTSATHTAGSTFQTYINYSPNTQGANKEGAIILGTSSGAMAVSTWYVSTFTYNQSTGAGAFYLNNSANGTFTNAQSIAGGIDTIGSNYGSNQWLNGSISYLVITNATYDSTFQACLVTNRL
jgi:hypothetical protein